MNRKTLQIFLPFMAMVVLTALLLVRVRANYVLGTPGVRVADVPIYAVSDKLTNIASNVSVPLPETVLDYTSFPEYIHPLELQMLPPDTVYGRRTYQAPDGVRMMISVVLMGTDRTSIHKPQYCLTGQGQSIIHSEVFTLQIPRPHPYDLQVMKLTTASEARTKDGQVIPLRGLFLYWFVADGQLTAHHGERMWLMGRDLLTKGLLQRWAYVAYWAVCLPGQEDALLERMKEFIAASLPEFQTTAGAPVSTAVSLDWPAVALAEN